VPSPRTLALLVAAFCAAVLGLGSAAAPAPAPAWRILVFTKTAGYRHDSIPAAIQAVEQLGAENGFGVDATEDSTVFNDANLARYDAVMFLLTTGDVLNDDQQAAFKRYIEAGGGFVGVHSAADTEHNWPWYGGLVGAYFLSHPAIQTALIDVVDPSDPSTAALPAQWTRTDEWYNFATDPSGSVHVLATIDETTYDPGDGAMGADHPIAWEHNYDGGRAWYTAGGHTSESYSEPLFLAHLLGGIMYAADPGRNPAPSAAAAPPAAQLKIVSLTTAVHGRRVAVSVRSSGCGRCSARVQVSLPNRSLTSPLRLHGVTATGSTATLPPGRWRLAVVVADEATGLTKTARRWVVVG
jgi:type 1 glutamine amidotransferase